MERSSERRDPTDRSRPFRQPLLQVEGAQAPLRACLLSGGESRRMGTDKALLPHPEGGSWLERTLRLLLQLEIPVTLLSRHPAHLQLAKALERTQSTSHAVSPPHRPSDVSGESPVRSGCAAATASHWDGSAATGPPRLTALAEAPPWEGPLLALHRLMQRYPDAWLLLCPVDMPWLNLAVLRTLLAAAGRPAAAGTARLLLAHDGERLQPLLGLYPSSAPIRTHLAAAVASGERRLQHWLAEQPCQPVCLDPEVIRNINRPAAAQPAETPGT